MRLLHTTIPYTASANNSLAGYPADHLRTPAIGQPWRGSAPLGSTWVQASHSEPGALHLGLQDVGSGTTASAVRAGTANPPTAVVATFVGAVHADGTGRKKGVVAVPAPSEHVRATLGSFANDYRIGAMYLFADALHLPDALLRSEITIEYPQASIKLPNGTEFPVDRGPPRTRITLRWRRPRTEDIEEVARIARAGICWLDLQNPDQPGWQWPVRCISATHARQLTHARQDEATLEFVEVV